MTAFEKTLYVVTSPLYQARAKTVMAHVLRDREAGHSPVVAACYASQGTCDTNIWGLPETCRRCNRFVDQIEQQTGIDVVRINASQDQAAEVSEAANSVLTTSIESTLMSSARLTRELLKWMPGYSRKYNAMRRTALGFLTGLRKLFTAHAIDRVCFFNGRTATSCSPKALAIEQGCDFLALEFSLNGAFQAFPNTSPHDRAYRQKQMRDAPTPIDRAAFAQLQTPKGNVFLQAEDPAGIPLDRPFVVVFESSGDEVAAFTDWQRQVELQEFVEAIVERTGFDVVIRWHPNQATSGTNQVLLGSRAALAVSDRVHVITPWMKANSYNLMNRAEAVFTYGSTIGVESAWAGKPTFLLGSAWYDEQSFAPLVGSVDDIPGCFDWPRADRVTIEHDCLNYLGHMYDWGYALETAKPVVKKEGNDPSARIDFQLDVAPDLQRSGVSALERRYRISQQVRDYFCTRWLGLPIGLKRSFPHGEITQKPFVVRDQKVQFI